MAAASDLPLTPAPAVPAPVSEPVKPVAAKAPVSKTPVVPATKAAEPKSAEPKAAEPKAIKPASKAAKVAPAPVSPPVAAKVVKAAQPVATKSVAAKPAVAKPVAAKAAKAPVAKPAMISPTIPSPAATGSSPLPSRKDKTMTTTAFDMTSAFKTAFEDLTGKAKTVYEKSSSAMTEANDFAKGNVEAVVESSKILATGLQEMGTAVVEESRTAFETMTAEVKSLAAAKSPTEFFQLQSALLRKHFDAAVAQTSKSTEAMLKLANESMAPISNRVTIAVEKVSKVA